MESNRQRALVSRRIFGKLVKIAKTVGEAVDIHDDPLGDRYEVNKYGIIIESESLPALQRLHEKLMAELKAEGWEIEPWMSKGAQAGLPSLSTAKALIDAPGTTMHPKIKRFDIGVY